MIDSSAYSFFTHLDTHTLLWSGEMQCISPSVESMARVFTSRVGRFPPSFWLPSVIWIFQQDTNQKNMQHLNHWQQEHCFCGTGLYRGWDTVSWVPGVSARKEDLIPIKTEPQDKN